MSNRDLEIVIRHICELPDGEHITVPFLNGMCSTMQETNMPERFSFHRMRRSFSKIASATKGRLLDSNVRSDLKKLIK